MRAERGPHTHVHEEQSVFTGESGVFFLTTMAQARRARHRTAFRSHEDRASPQHVARLAAVAAMEATASAAPVPRAGTQTPHSEAALRALLLALSKPIAVPHRRALLDALCAGVRVWRPEDEWDPDWRRAAETPAVQQAVADGASLAAPDFKAGVHVPREAAEHLAVLPWPRRRSDFLAFPMPGFCHAAAAVMLALAQAARPREDWVILISTLHACVLSLSSATLVDVNAAAMCAAYGERAEVDPCTYLQRLVLPDENFAVYPSLDAYLSNLRPSITHSRPLPAWARASGCDRAAYEQLRASGALDAAFARAEQMLVVPPGSPQDVARG